MSVALRCSRQGSSGRRAAGQGAAGQERSARWKRTCAEGARRSGQGHGSVTRPTCLVVRARASPEGGARRGVRGRGAEPYAEAPIDRPKPPGEASNEAPLHTERGGRLFCPAAWLPLARGSPLAGTAACQNCRSRTSLLRKPLLQRPWPKEPGQELPRFLLRAGLKARGNRRSLGCSGTPTDRPSSTRPVGENTKAAP